jgi:hypothetical protein
MDLKQRYFLWQFTVLKVTGYIHNTDCEQLISLVTLLNNSNEQEGCLVGDTSKSFGYQQVFWVAATLQTCILWA